MLEMSALETLGECFKGAPTIKKPLYKYALKYWCFGLQPQFEVILLVSKFTSMKVVTWGNYFACLTIFQWIYFCCTIPMLYHWSTILLGSQWQEFTEPPLCVWIHVKEMWKLFTRHTLMWSISRKQTRKGFILKTLMGRNWFNMEIIYLTL